MSGPREEGRKVEIKDGKKKKEKRVLDVVEENVSHELGMH